MDLLAFSVWKQEQGQDHVKQYGFKLLPRFAAMLKAKDYSEAHNDTGWWLRLQNTNYI